MTECVYINIPKQLWLDRVRHLRTIKYSQKLYCMDKLHQNCTLHMLTHNKNIVQQIKRIDNELLKIDKCILKLSKGKVNNVFDDQHECDLQLGSENLNVFHNV